MADVGIVFGQARRPQPGGALGLEGLSAVLNAPTDEFVVPNNGSVYLLFANEHATEEATITVVTPATVDANAVADRSMTLVANSRSALIGPWPPGVYGSELRIKATAAGSIRVAAYAVG